MGKVLIGNIKGTKGDEGRSAYQVAKANGFKGTEAEWLESLKGSQITKIEHIGVDANGGYIYRMTFDDDRTCDFVAPKGEPGKNGEPGENGEDGTDGLSILQLNSSLAGSAEYYHFSNFTLLNGRIPKVNDLVLFNDGNVGYIHNVNTYEETATVAHIAGITFKGEKGSKGDKGDKGDKGEKGDKGDKGENGVSPSVNVSKTGKVTTIKITDANGTKTATIRDGEDGAGGGGGGSSEDIIIPETSLTLTGFGSGSKTAIHSDVSIEIGKTYTVIWNGVKYSCVGKDPGSDYKSVILGNGVYVGLPTTDEPFCLRFHNDTELTENVTIISREYITTATIKVTTPSTIDPTRIPDMYYTEERQDVEILPTSTAIDTGNAIMGELYVVGDSITLVEGKTYKVIYNGVKYECVAIAGVVQGESSILLGDVAVLETGTPSGAYPFVIATNDYMVSLGACAAVIPLNGSTSVTVSIVGYGEEIHHLPSKYIKDMYYEEETELLSETALTFTNVDGMMMATIENPSFALEAGKTYVVIYNGTEYICECDPEHLVLGNIGALMGTPTDEPFVIGTMDGTFGAISVYGETNATLSIKTNVVNKIKNKYIDFSEVVPVIDLTALGLPYVSPDDMGGGQTPTLDLETCNYIRSAMRKGALIFKYNEGYSEPYKEKSVLVTNIVIDHTGRYSASTCAPTDYGDIVDISFGIYGSGTSSITVTYRNHPVGNLKKDYILLYSKNSKGYYIKVTNDGELYATDNALE